MRDPLGLIVRCSACCLIGLGLFAFAAGAAPVAPTGFDRPPLLLIHWTTDTIAAQHIETSVVIHAGGATEITEITDGEPARMLRGNPTPADFQRLVDTLLNGQIGVAQGGCGAPTADGPINYEITWYGSGARFNTFKVGADLSSCNAGLRTMVESMLELVNAVRPAPDTQQFPRNRPH